MLLWKIIVSKQGPKIFDRYYHGIIYQPCLKEHDRLLLCLLIQMNLAPECTWTAYKRGMINVLKVLDATLYRGEFRGVAAGLSGEV